VVISTHRVATNAGMRCDFMTRFRSAIPRVKNMLTHYPSDVRSDAVSAKLVSTKAPDTDIRE
jgi:hypothetical protein